MENKDKSYNPVEVKLLYDEFKDPDQVGSNNPLGQGCISSDEYDKKFHNHLQDILKSK